MTHSIAAIALRAKERGDEELAARCYEYISRKGTWLFVDHFGIAYELVDVRAVDSDFQGGVYIEATYRNVNGGPWMEGGNFRLDKARKFVPALDGAGAPPPLSPARPVERRQEAA